MDKCIVLWFGYIALLRPESVWTVEKSRRLPEVGQMSSRPTANRELVHSKSL